MKAFRSRISVLLLLSILWVLALIAIAVSRDNVYEGIFVLGGLFVFIVLLLAGIRYVVSEDKLFLKIWFISAGSVDIADIRSVRRSYNPLSSPAASLKRLRIGLRKDWMLISPARERAFIDALKAVNSRIVVDVSEKQGMWRIWDWDI